MLRITIKPVPPWPFSLKLAPSGCFGCQLPAGGCWGCQLHAACCSMLPDGESAAGHIGRLCRASGALDRTQRRQLHRCAEVVKVVYSSAVQQLVQHCSGHILRWLQTRLLLCVLHTRLVLCGLQHGLAYVMI